MRIHSTVLRNFRNFSASPVFHWEPGINLILGANGSGKTNLLEALSILSGWGAFGRTRSVISWQNEDKPAFICAEVAGEERHSLTANIASRISLRCDDKGITSTDIRLVLPSVLFLSGNISLIDGSPSARRLFIDRLCALFYPPFAKRLADFKYVMRTRTILLRQGKNPGRTDAPYCGLGGWIMEKRREVVSQLMGIIPQGRFMMSVVPEVKGACDEFLRDALKRNYAREVRALRPQDGPSYDDLALTVCSNGRPASEALSRGQKRRLVLFLLITAGKLIARRMHKEPVMLLDDLTAELDAEGREFVHVELAKTKWQVFLTAPECPFSGGACYHTEHLPARK